MRRSMPSSTRMPPTITAAHAGRKHQDEHNRRRSGLARCIRGDGRRNHRIAFHHPGSTTMKKKMTAKERRKLRGEREWQRIQAEKKFYAGFENGPITFTRPGPVPVRCGKVTRSM